MGFTTSAAEQVAAHAKDARVVAALPPFAELIASGKPELAGRVPSVFCCSDDADAKSTVAGLIGELGADAVDAGPLVTARLVEPAMMLVVGLAYATVPPRSYAMALLRGDA